jgi:hypothetical protein
LVESTKISVPSNHHEKILTKNSLIVRLNSFQELLEAANVLNNLRFEERDLKAGVLFGNLKVFDGNFYETVDVKSNE